MIRLGGLLALAAACAASPCLAQPVPLDQASADAHRIALIARLRPSVVHVRAVPKPRPPGERGGVEDLLALTRRPGGDRSEQGSGFVVDSARGLVLTAAHLVARAERIAIVESDGNERPARLLVNDPQRGFALLQVDGPAGPALELSGQTPRAGQSSLLIGFMLPAKSLVAIDGMVMGHVAVPSDALSAAAAPGPYYATSAAIPNGGFGGSPVVDLDGRAIGLVTAIYGRDYGGGSLTLMLPIAPLLPLIAGQIAATPPRR